MEINIDRSQVARSVAEDIDNRRQAIEEAEYYKFLVSINSYTAKR